MIKQVNSSFAITATTTQTKYLGDMVPYEGCSIQVVWSGATGATGKSSTLQVVQSDDGTNYDTIAPLVQVINTPSGSVTFEHNQFEAAHVAIKNTQGATALTAGTLNISIVRRSVK